MLGVEEADEVTGLKKERKAGQPNSYQDMMAAYSVAGELERAEQENTAQAREQDKQAVKPNKEATNAKKDIEEGVDEEKVVEEGKSG